MTYQIKKRNGTTIFVPKIVSFYGIDGTKKTCDICGKEFMKKPNRKIHNCNKNKCEQCGKYFSANSDLKRHVKIVHEKIKEFTCDIPGVAPKSLLAQKYAFTKKSTIFTQSL